MDIELPKDFKEFLSLFRAHGVRYLLVGGYAVIFYGYSRTTVDLDIWIAVEPENADRIVAALREFGFHTPDLNAGLFLQDEKIIRMGNMPVRIEIMTGISGVSFEECYANRVDTIIDGAEVSLINLDHLKQNKRASARHKDLMDLEKLP